MDLTTVAPAYSNRCSLALTANDFCSEPLEEGSGRVGAQGIAGFLPQAVDRRGLALQGELALQGGKELML